MKKAETKKMTWKMFTTALLVCAVGFFSGTLVAQDKEEDVSVEALYRKAFDLRLSGKYQEASETFEKMFDLSGGTETLFEDYGAKAGGFFFDYGMTLIPQQRWEDAKKAFHISFTAEAWKKKVLSKIPGKNARESLSQFQLAFCEAQLGNHEEALKLYDSYLASNPPPEELQQVRSSFKLRRGTTLLKLGRMDEGISSIQEIFDNREEWKVKAPFLMQGILELGLGWAEAAKAAGAEDEGAIDLIEAKGHAFLNEYGDFVKVRAMDQFRLGFVDRLKKLGYESTKAGLYTLALRYFAYTPTIQQIRDDVNLSLTQLPIGSGIPSQYQAILDQLKAREAVPVHPDLETLRLTANCYERLGNIYSARVIYWYLAESFPDIEKEKRGEILHEASRYSSMIGDFQAAQYFGELFMEEMPADNRLRSNVDTFTLQSLFTQRLYDQVIGVCEKVRANNKPGAPERELADSLYCLALYSTKQYEKAEAPFKEYVEAFPDGKNLEMVMFHRASNALILRKMRSAGELYEDFLKKFPKSERFGDIALADLATARYNLSDYPEAIKVSERLQAFKPDSVHLGRTLNIEGDSYIVQSDAMKQKEQKEQRLEMRKKGLEAYLAAAEAAGRALKTVDSEQAEYYQNVAAEGLWKAADIYFVDGDDESGLKLYDKFVKDYSGTFWEPQISVFSLKPLQAAGRGEEGLVQVEKMINVLGNKSPDKQDLKLLRQAIGSYSEESEKIRGAEKTAEIFDNFPGLNPANKALLTWLKIQKIIVLQGMKKKLPKGESEAAAVDTKIATVFKELEGFEKRNLSEFALEQIGLYLSKGDNPFRAVPYFEELMSRTSPEAKPFKANAEMALGVIEMRSPDAALVRSSRERFRRIIDVYKTKELVPEAYLNLAKLHMANKEWKEAKEALVKINKSKKFFGKEKVKRAEAGFLLGRCLEELNDPVGAAKAYLGVVSTYNAFPDFVTQAWERYIKISEADIAKMETGTPELDLAKRERELALYRLCTKYIYMWQRWDEKKDCPSGALGRLRRDLIDMKGRMTITPEEQKKIEDDLGLNAENK